MTTTSHDGEYDAREQIAQTEQAEAERGRAARATRLFDLRRVIGGLLAVYGAMLTVVGLFASAATKAKAAGININLWAGLAMLVVGLAFLAWAFLRPLRAEELTENEEESPSGRYEQAEAR